MIWIQHDFYNNFVQSIDTEDIEMSFDIFRSELSDLLTYRSQSLFNLFDKLKIKHKKKASYEELVDIVIDEIKKNEKFVRGLSFLIGESNKVVKNNKDLSWQKILNRITKGIEIIAKTFIDYPKKEKLFKRQLKEMVGLKSSVTGNDTRQLNKKDNTILWIVGITVVCVAGYFIYQYFDKQKQERMRLESLNPKSSDLDALKNIAQPNVTTPNNTQASTPIPEKPIDPAFTVPSDVLLPEQPNIPNSNAANTGSVQINVSTTPQNQVNS
jgi:hypothetical protein